MVTFNKTKKAQFLLGFFCALYIKLLIKGIDQNNVTIGKNRLLQFR